jgi:AcrR family transcriptional regulator
MAMGPQSTRDRILDSAYILFYREGFARVSVDAIAARAKVTKRTVYYHFQSKDDIVAAALENQNDYLVRQFQGWIGPESTSSVETVDRLFKELKDWADGTHWLGSGFSRITAELVDMPGHPARHAARTHKAKIEFLLANRFAAVNQAEPSRLARQIMILIEGSMSLSLIHGDTKYIECAGNAARNLLPRH